MSNGANPHMGIRKTALANACLALLIGALPRIVVAEGCVVVSVHPEQEAARAGVRPGDRVTGWSRASSPPANPEPAEGSIRSWFDLFDAEVEQGPRGLV